MRKRLRELRGKWRGVLLSVAIANGAAGCQRTDDFGTRYPASGTIALDGVPLKTGRVLFIPLQDGPATQGKIVDGVYDLPAAEGPGAGSYRIEIHGEQRPTGKKFFDGDANAFVEEVRDIVPEKFNAKSTLHVEIKPESENVFSYDLATSSTKGAAAVRK